MRSFWSAVPLRQCLIHTVTVRFLHCFGLLELRSDSAFLALLRSYEVRQCVIHTVTVCFLHCCCLGGSTVCHSHCDSAFLALWTPELRSDSVTFALLQCIPCTVAVSWSGPTPTVCHSHCDSVSYTVASCGRSRPGVPFTLTVPSALLRF